MGESKSKRWLIQFVSTDSNLWAVLVPGDRESIEILLAWMNSLVALGGFRLPDGTRYDVRGVTTDFPGEILEVNPEEMREFLNLDEDASLPDLDWTPVFVDVSSSLFGLHQPYSETMEADSFELTIVFRETRHHDEDERVYLRHATLEALLPDVLEELASIKA